MGRWRELRHGVRWTLYVVSHPLLTIPVAAAALAGLVWRIVQAPDQVPAWLVFAASLSCCVGPSIIVTGLLSDQRP
jgi:hypothetical protein